MEDLRNQLRDEVRALLVDELTPVVKDEIRAELHEEMSEKLHVELRETIAAELRPTIHEMVLHEEVRKVQSEVNATRDALTKKMIAEVSVAREQQAQPVAATEAPHAPTTAKALPKTTAEALPTATAATTSGGSHYGRRFQR